MSKINANICTYGSATAFEIIPDNSRMPNHGQSMFQTGKRNRVYGKKEKNLYLM